MTPKRDLGEQWSIVLHSTWTGLVMTGLGAAILVAFAVVLAVSSGFNWFTGLFLFASLIGAAVVLGDMPVATEFSSHGIIRRMPLRRHHVGWAEISRMHRLRKGIIRSRGESSGGGLVLRAGKRTYVLTDVMESRAEFDHIRTNLGIDHADELGLDDGMRPAEEQPPTWRYRRRRWHHESA